MRALYFVFSYRPANVFVRSTVSSLSIFPRETATHLGLSALSNLLNKAPGRHRACTTLVVPAHTAFLLDGSTVTVDALRVEVRKLVGDNVELPEDLESAIGEL